MSRQYWEELIWWATADGTSINTSTTETIIFPDVTLPGNYMSDGRVLRVVAFGTINTTATPTIRFRARWGGVAGTLLWDSGTITTTTVALAMWMVDLWIQTRANGASGSLFALGLCIVGSAAAPTVASATGAPAIGIYGSAGDDTPVPVTAALNVDTAFSLTAQWSASSASNAIVGKNYFGESKN